MDDKMSLTELVDLDVLQKMQNSFSNMAGVAAVITDANGNAITKPSNFTDFCQKNTWNSPEGKRQCASCNKKGIEMALSNGCSCTLHCHAGLVIFAAPITLNNKLIGGMIGGQVLPNKNPHPEDVVKHAMELGIDPVKYLEALRKVPRLENSSMDKINEFISTMASTLSEIANNSYLLYAGEFEIERAARMKSDFLANMSHEIRTPMNAVIGMAEMALREDLPPAAREYIMQIKSSGRTLLTIINDILDFSKIESGKLNISVAPYEPMSIINDVVNMLMTRIGSKNLELILNVSPNIPHTLLGDDTRIKQILVNICNNAVKFTQKGHVTVNISFVQKSESTIDLLFSVEDTGIGIKKEELGKLFQSFQQLDSKRNRNIEGTGLGLAISRQLLNLMDGDINVKSEYNVGTTFSFNIPQTVIDPQPSIIIRKNEHATVACLAKSSYVKNQLKQDITQFGGTFIELDSIDDLSFLPNGVNFIFIEQPMFTPEIEYFLKANQNITGILMIDFHDSARSSIPNLKVIKKPLYSLNIASILNGEKIRLEEDEGPMDTFEFIAPTAEVLVVDDNSINLTVACGLLEPLKMKLDTATSGKEAIEKISNKHYDIIFMDHMMPEIDGVETTRIIRRLHKEYNDVPIIALTANAVDGTKEMFLEEGMNDFIPKPIEMRTMMACLKHWLPTEKITAATGVIVNSTAETDSEDINIEGLDTDSALKLLGSKELFWDVLKDYYKVIDKKCTLIKQYESSNSWPEYTIEVHALKSASKQIGALELSATAAQMEKAGNERNASVIHKYTDGMLQMYKYYESVLAQYFEKNEEDENSNIKTSVSNNEILEALSSIKDAVENLDMDKAEEITSKLNTYELNDTQADLLGKIRDAVNDFDADACTPLIEEWISLM